MKRPFGSIGAPCEPDLAVADLKLLELHIVALEIRRIAHVDHRIAVSSRPFGVDPMVTCILDNSVENVVGWDRQDSGTDFFERELDGVSAGHAGSRDDGDDRLDPALLQKKGEGDVVKLKQNARFVNFRWEMVGEMGDEIFGKPCVDFLVRKHGLPARLIANIVAELKALRHELLGFPRPRCTRQKNHFTVIRGLVRQGKPPDHRNRGDDAKTETEPEQPFASFVHRTSRSLVEGDATLETDHGSRAASRGVHQEGLEWRRGRTTFKLYGLRSNRSTLAPQAAHGFKRSRMGGQSPVVPTNLPCYWLQPL